MKYEMQIKIEDPADRNKKIWRSVRQAPNRTPYQYDTEEEAYRMLRMCYGHALCCDEMRVLKVAQ